MSRAALSKFHKRRRALTLDLVEMNSPNERDENVENATLRN